MLRDGYRPTPRPGAVPHPPQGGTDKVPLAPSYVPDSALEPHTLRGAGEVVLDAEPVSGYAPDSSLEPGPIQEPASYMHDECAVCGKAQIYEVDELDTESECLCRACGAWAVGTLAHLADEAFSLYGLSRCWAENRAKLALDAVEDQRFRADLAIVCNRLIKQDAQLANHRLWLARRGVDRLRRRLRRQTTLAQARLHLLMGASS